MNDKIIIYGKMDKISIIENVFKLLRKDVVNITDDKTLKEKGVQSLAFEYKGEIYTQFSKLIKKIQEEMMKNE